MRLCRKTALTALAGLLLLAGCTAGGEIPDLGTARRAAEAGDFARARAHYETLAAKGYPQAQIGLAALALEESAELSPARRAEIAAILESAAQSENPVKAYELLARMALTETPPDTEKALAFYQKAYDLGAHRVAMKIGDTYAETGRGQTARDWYFKALEAGDVKAVQRLGRLYEQGKALDQDYVTAMAFYLWGQELGIPESAKGIERVGKKLSPEAVEQASALVPKIKSGLFTQGSE